MRGFRLFILTFFLCHLSYGLVIETYGDSLTFGVMAKTRLASTNPTAVSQMLSDLTKYIVTQDLSLLTRYGGNTDAWPQFLADKLAINHSEKIEIRNQAVGGVTTTDLSRQVKSLGVQLQKDTKAFFFIGHNDLCPNLQTEPEALAVGYTAIYQKALKIWDENHSESTAYILPVSNVDEVLEVLNQYVWFQDEKGTYRCNQQWNMYFPYCRKFGDLAASGTARQVLHPRIAAMNAALRDVVEKMRTFSRKNRYVFVKDLHSITYKPEYFAADCFHLSPEGQKVFSEAVFSNL